MKSIKKIGVLCLVIAMLCTTIPMNVLALDNKEIIDYTVEYNETKESALIKFDVTSIDTSKYEILDIVIDDKLLDLSSPQYQVKENKEYNFNVRYIDKQEEVLDIEEKEEVTQSNEEVDTAIATVQEVVTQSNEEVDTSTNNGIEKEETITIKVDGILSIEEVTPIVPNNYALQTATSSDVGSEDGNIDLLGMFDIVGSTWKGAGTGTLIPTGSQGVAQMTTVSKKNIHIGNGTYAYANGYTNLTAKMLSKFRLDMSKSFSLSGKMKTTGYNPDGFAVGLINSSSREAFLTKRPVGGNLGIYGIPEIEGAIFYEVDFYSNGLSGCLDHLIASSQTTTPHTMMAYIKNGVPYNITAPEHFSLNKVEDERQFTIEYHKHTDLLEIGYGDRVEQYAGVSAILKEDETYFFLSGAVDSWRMAGYDGNVEMDVQVDSFKYTDIEPTSSVEYYTKRSAGLVKYDSDDYTTYPQGGEEVLVRHSFNNTLESPVDEAATANISVSTMDGSAVSPKNIKMYIGSPENPIIESMDEKDIFNGSKNDEDMHKQVTVPIMANQEKTYLEYEYTIPSDKTYYQLDDAIVFGQQGMTQYPFSGSAKIASLPVVTGVDETVTYAIGTGDMSDVEVRKGMQGKAFDEAGASNLETDTTNLQATYTVDGSSSKKIDLSKEGRYFVEYTVEDIRTGLKKNVSRYLWVTDKNSVVNGEEIMAAKDFYMLSSEVDGNIMELIKERSGIEVYRMDGTVIPFEQLTISQDIKGNFDIYPVTFTTASGTTLTVQCRVFDKGHIDEINKEAIYGNDFSLSEVEATGIENEELKQLARVVAFDTTTMADVAVQVQSNTIKGKTQGLYSLTFVTDKGSAITVQVRITKHGKVENNERITANDFYIDAMDAKRKDPSVLIGLAKASAITVDSGKVVEVLVDASGVQAVKGTYSVIFKTAKGTSITVQATVVEKGAENPDNTIHEAIYGNNFSMTSKEVVELLTKSDSAVRTALITKAGAKAVHIDTGVDISVTTVEQSLKTKEITDTDGNKHTVAIEGLYDVTFETAKGTSITVKASVPSSVENDTLLLYANGFTVSKDQVASLKSNDYLLLGKAQAIVKADSSNVDVTVDSSAIQATPGVYPIKYATDYTTDQTKNLLLTVNVTVVQHGTTNPTNRESINANDIYLKKSEVATLTSKKLVDKAGAFAIKIDTGEYVDVEAIYDIKEQVGTYEVTFETALGTSLKVQAYVFDGGTVNNGEAIYGNTLVLSIDEASTPSEALLKNRAKVEAIDIVTKAPVAVTTVTHTIVNKVGKYTATFATAKGTSITVDVQVVEHSITDNGETIVASDMHLSVDQVKTLTNEQVILLSKARGYQTIDGSSVELVADYTSVKETSGSYEVTIRSKNTGTALVVKAHVYDRGIMQGNIAIYGNDMEMSKAEAEGISDATIKRLANVKAYREDTGVEIDSVDITVFHTIVNKVGMYKVTFTTNLVALEVKARVSDHGKEENQERITGNDFSLYVSEVGSLTEDKVIQLSNAKADSTVDGKDIEIAAVYDAIQEKQGTYTVILETKTAYATKIELKVTVLSNGFVDETKREAIYGENFSLSVSDAKNVSDETLKKLSNVKAVDLDTGSSVEVSSVVHTIRNVKGEYTATFATTKKTSTTVKVTVVENEVVNPAKNEKIIANDFEVTKSEVEKGITDDQILLLSRAKAYNTLTNTEIPIPTVTHHMEAKTGKYTVELSTLEGTTILVKATVVDKGIVDETTREGIYGNDFIISDEEAKGISDEAIKTHAKVQAIDIDTGESVAIQRVRHGITNKKGVYEVTFFTAKGSNMNVQATVVDEVHEDINNGERIFANHFTITKEEVKDLTTQQVVDLAKAKAIKIEDGSKVEIGVDYNKIKEQIGSYAVTFKTTKGTSITVQATVIDEGNVDETNGEAIYGNNFTISDKEAKEINDEMVKKLSNVQAYSIDTGAIIEVTSVEHHIEASKGNYAVTFKTTKGASVTVQATVVDEVHEDIDNGERIFANHFTISKKEVKDLTTQQVMDLAKAKAINIVDGSKVEIEVEYSKIKEEIGSYTVTFKTTKGTSVNVLATVTDHGVVDETNREAIYGNDFTIKAEQVNELNDEMVKKLSNAQAYTIDTGAIIEVTGVEHHMEASEGKYTVTFKTTKGTSVNVLATVTKTSDPEKPNQPGSPNQPDNSGNFGNTEGSPDNFDQGNIGVILPKQFILKYSGRDVTVIDEQVASDKSITSSEKRLSTNSSKEKDDISSNTTTCITHLGMVAAILLYIVYMILEMKRGKADE